MATATLTLSDGTRVNIEGAPEEVAVILEKLSGPRIVHSKPAGSRSVSRLQKTKKARKSVKDLIQQLLEDDFFKSRKTIAEIQQRLEAEGHIYPVTHLSTPLLRLTRDKSLRRIKEKTGWVYVA
jgi:hypothetical protein